MNLQQIQEALSKIQEKDALSLTHYHHDISNTDPQHTSIHSDWVHQRNIFLEKHPIAKEMFAKGGEKRDWQIRIPVEMNNSGGAPNSVVIRYLRQSGKVEISPEMYRNGILTLTKTVGNPEKGIPETEKEVQYSIGKYLRMIDANTQVIKLYENDPFRANQDGKYDLIITGHPIDIYGGSTGRGWTSCMDVSDKQFHDPDDEENDEVEYSTSNAAAHIKSDINEQHHMVYLVKRGGDVDNNAIARTSFKLHHSLSNHGADTLLPEGTVYGTAPTGFLSLATEKMHEIFKVEDGLYMLSHSMYADSTRLKTIGDVKITVESLGKIAYEFNRIEEYYDDYEQTYDAKASFISNVSNSINKMNQHDSTLMLVNLLTRCDNLIQGHFRHSSEDPNDDLNSLLSVHQTVFEELEDAIGSDFDEALLNSLDAELVNEAFQKTGTFRELFGDFVTNSIDNDNYDIYETIDRVDACQATQIDIAFKKNNPTSLYRFMLLSSHISTIEKINTKLVYNRHFEGQTSTKIISELFKSMVLGMSENEDWHDLGKIVNNFGALVQSMISVKYTALDLFRIVEEEFGDKDLDRDVDEMHTAKEWFEYAIVEVISGTSSSGAHLKLRDGGIVFLGNDEKNLKTVVALIKAHCSEQSTIARIAELIQSEHFDMIKELGAGVYQKVERKEEPKVIPKEEPKVEPTPAPTQSSAQKLAKYRNTETGATWSGRGLKPKWVYDWLDANPGKTIQDLET